MAVETVSATKRGNNNAAGHGLASSVKVLVATGEMPAAASASSVIDFGEIPNNARILPQSAVYWDDLASSGSPTLDIGLFAVNGNIASDDDAFKADLDVATSATSSALVTAIESFGKRAWEFVNGQTSAPQGNLAVKGTIKDAAVNTGGTITLVLYYTVD